MVQRHRALAHPLHGDQAVDRLLHKSEDPSLPRSSREQAPGKSVIPAFSGMTDQGRPSARVNGRVQAVSQPIGELTRKVWSVPGVVVATTMGSRNAIDASLISASLSLMWPMTSGLSTSVSFATIWTVRVRSLRGIESRCSTTRCATKVLSLPPEKPTIQGFSWGCAYSSAISLRITSNMSPPPLLFPALRSPRPGNFAPVRTPLNDQGLEVFAGHRLICVPTAVHLDQHALALWSGLAVDAYYVRGVGPR